ncbi:MAG: TIGR00725 family protein [Fidelibacterota bacterium]|nr:MAG: TIGR00725 family protein [Candidatus Neomarinimicrobiota bacterium]
MKRIPIIGVMGGGQVPSDTEKLAHELGRALAGNGWIVLNGGRNAGVMAAVSAGAASAGGMIVGILPDQDLSRASPHLTIPIRTGLGDGRNVLNILSSDVVVALPGSAGTLSEIALALKHGKPLLMLGWESLPIDLSEADTVDSFQSIPLAIDRIREMLAALE